MMQFSLILLLSTSLVHAASRPNVIVIVADDLGWDDVSFHGSQQIPTPNIDALAYDGIILNNYYVQPICTPTRGALMSGRHPIHTGLQHSVILGSQPYGLPLNETIMPQYFKKIGYSTHIVGKWHLGMYAKEFTPTYRGFDSHLGYYTGCEDYYDHTHDAGGKKGEEWGLDFRSNMTVLKDKFGQYSTNVFCTETERIIKEHDTDKPLFLYLPHQAVHSGNRKTPLEAPWKYVEKFQHIEHEGRRMFAAMVSALDDAVGNVTKALHDRNMLKNSIIVFTTDNGGPPAGFNRNYASNWPLRGIKSSLWEGGVRGAGFIWSQLLKKSGYVSEHMMHVCDHLPTLLSAAGYSMSSLPKNLDGFDMWKSLSTNGPSPRKEILHNIDPIDKYRSVRVGDMKLIDGLYAPMWQGWYAPESVDTDPRNFARQSEHAPMHLFKGAVKPILNTYGRGYNPEVPVQVTCGPKPANASTNCNLKDAACLFNITADPCEYNNIADEHVAVVDALLHKLTQYQRTAVPALDPPQDPAGYPSNNNWIWGPWLTLNTTQLKEMGLQ